MALARGDWEQALLLAQNAIDQARLRGRVKYESFGLETRAAALVAQGRVGDAIADLQSAVTITRPSGDPAMFLRAAASLCKLEGDDQLFAEARLAAQHIMAELPSDEMRRTFQEADLVREVLK